MESLNDLLKSPISAYFMLSLLSLKEFFGHIAAEITGVL